MKSLASSKIKMSRENGLIQMIILIVVAVAILMFLGKDPVYIWQEHVRPIVEFALKIFIVFIDFLVRILTQAWNAIFQS